MQKQAKITSKGQITVPREIRRAFGVRAGDRLVFESVGQDIRVRAVKTKSAFSKYRGIGNPGIGPRAQEHQYLAARPAGE